MNSYFQPQQPTSNSYGLYALPSVDQGSSEAKKIEQLLHETEKAYFNEWENLQRLFQSKIVQKNNTFNLLQQAYKMAWNPTAELSEGQPHNITDLEDKSRILTNEVIKLEGELLYPTGKLAQLKQEYNRLVNLLKEVIPNTAQAIDSSHTQIADRFFSNEQVSKSCSM